MHFTGPCELPEVIAAGSTKNGTHLFGHRMAYQLVRLVEAEIGTNLAKFEMSVGLFIHK